MKTLSFKNWVNEGVEPELPLLRQLGIVGDVEFDFRPVGAPINRERFIKLLNSITLSNGELITRVTGWSNGSRFAVSFILTDGTDHHIYTQGEKVFMPIPGKVESVLMTRSQFSELIKKHKYVIMACVQLINNYLSGSINESSEPSNPLLLRQLGIQELEFKMRYGTGNAFDDDNEVLNYTDYDTDESFCSSFVRADGEMLLSVSGFVESFKMDVDMTFTDGTEFGFAWNADDSWSRIYVVSAITKPGEPRSIVSTQHLKYEDLDTLATNGLGLMHNIIQLASNQLAAITNSL